MEDELLLPVMTKLEPLANCPEVWATSVSKVSVEEVISFGLQAYCSSPTNANNKIDLNH